MFICQSLGNYKYKTKITKTIHLLYINYCYFKKNSLCDIVSVMLINMEQGREFLASPMSGSQEEGVWEEGVILKY